jgi:molecular chaperone DnaJ
MYVQVVVETPQKLTKRQRELLAEFDKFSSKDFNSDSPAFTRRDPPGAYASAP